MFAINKSGEVFVISFNNSFGVLTIKTCKKSKVHANRKGWPNEFLPLADGRHSDDPCKGDAEFLVTDNKFQNPLGTVSEKGILCAPYNSEREYCALQKI
jgi:hypothetical protein